jgi:suppressor for copper-sensitivity B
MKLLDPLWKPLTALLLLIVGLVPSPVLAAGATAASAWAETDHGAVRLISASETVGGGGVLLGLEFRLEDGWKVYWRSPGDAGYPPQLDWSRSNNLSAATMAWPLPSRFSIFDLQTVGYEGHVIFPIEAQVANIDRDLQLILSVNYLTCKDICIPYEATLALDLAAGPFRPSAFAHRINQYVNRVPGDGGRNGIDLLSAEVSGGDLRITAVASAEPFATPDVFVEGPEGWVFGAPRVALENDGRTAVMDLSIDGGGQKAAGLVGAAVTVTLVDGDRGAEKRFIVQRQGSFTGSLMADLPRFLAILGLGLLGGLILNLMPCVLPVLSIKLLGAIGHGGGDVRRVRLSFLASAAGIICSFVVLAGVLAAIKAGGAAVGWGFQFQQPWFLIAMMLLMTLFACNLLGFFEFRLPGIIAHTAPGDGHKNSLGGHFLMGALATLLATPCSAPFVGTAIGFALSRGTFEIFAVFLALGIGLAAPYLVVALLPRLATRLPRPGRWMTVLRRILGIALAGTTVWLAIILAGVAGTTSALMAAGLSVAAAALLFLLKHIPEGRLRRGTAVAISLLAAVAFLVPSEPVDRGAGPPESFWAPFDAAAIPGLVAEGRIIYVNITADWCITCQVNERVVLSDADVQARLEAGNVIAMRGDWTTPNETISRFLAGFGRYGIPFDAVYGPGLPDGEALPELLNRGAVLGALDRAAGSSPSGGARVSAQAPANGGSPPPARCAGLL